MHSFGRLGGGAAIVAAGVLIVLAPLGCGLDTEGTAAEGTGRVFDGGFGAGGSTTGEAGSAGVSNGGGGAAGTGVEEGGAAGTEDASVPGDGGGGAVGDDDGSAGGAGSGVDGGGSAGEAGIDAGREDCTNGLDDDDDGKIDCADEDCAVGYVCTDVVPDGGGDFYWVHEAPSPDSPPEPCPDGAGDPTAYFAGPNDAACEACQCGAWQGASCSAPKLECYESDKCEGTAHDWTDKVSTSCSKPALVGNKLSCKLTSAAALAKPGACQATGGGVTPAAPWKTRTDVCDAPSSGAGCAVGQACVARGKGPYQGSLCIRKADQVDCPEGWTSQVKTLFSGTGDARACSKCECAPPADAACSGGTYAVHDDDLCLDILGAKAKVIDSTTCTDASKLLSPALIPAIPAWSINAQPPKVTGGSCTPSGGEPSGSVTGEGPVTFCCK